MYMNVRIIEPYGFCFGVEKALETAYQAKKENPGSQIYILGDLVHNESVTKKLEQDGFFLLSEKMGSLEKQLLAVSNEAVLVFSAHGHSPKLDEIARKKKLKIYDATCIFVRKNEKQIAEEIQNRNEVMYIGIRNHAETNAALDIDSKRVHLMTPKESFCFSDVHSSSPLVVSQTTMTSDDIFSCEKEIKEKIPNAKFVAKQCYATEERQKEVILEGENADAFIVMGGKNSNNTAKLYQEIKNHFPTKKCIQISSLEEFIGLEKEFMDASEVVLVSGTSTPKEEIFKVYEFLTKHSMKCK